MRPEIAHFGQPATTPIPTQPPQQTVNIDHGIGSIGGTIIDPVVNNYGPPAPRITHTEERSAAPDGGQILTLYVRTDQPVPSPEIVICFSGPYTVVKEFSRDLNPMILNSTHVGYNLSTVVAVPDGQTVPNSLIIGITDPILFLPEMELRLKVESSEPIEIKEVGLCDHGRCPMPPPSTHR